MVRILHLLRASCTGGIYIYIYKYIFIFTHMVHILFYDESQKSYNLGLPFNSVHFLKMNPNLYDFP